MEADVVLADPPTSDTDFCTTHLISELTGEDITLHQCPTTEVPSGQHEVCIYRLDVSTRLRPHREKYVMVGENVQRHLLLAQGDTRNVCIPSMFRYDDKVTKLTLHCMQQSSQNLLEALELHFQNKVRRIKRDQEREKLAGVTPYYWKKVGINLGIFTRHKQDSNALKGFAALQQVKAEDWLSEKSVIFNGRLRPVPHAILESFCSEFVTPCLPVSYKYPTAKLELKTVAAPQFIGSPVHNKLHSWIDDEAHMRFSAPQVTAHTDVEVDQVADAFGWPIQNNDPE